MHWTFITILWNLGALFYILNFYHELQLFPFRAALLLVSGFIDADSQSGMDARMVLWGVRPDRFMVGATEELQGVSTHLP